MLWFAQHPLGSLREGADCLVVKESIPTGTRNVLSYVCWLHTYAADVKVFLHTPERSWFSCLMEGTVLVTGGWKGVNAEVFHYTLVIPFNWIFLLFSFPHISQKYVYSWFQLKLIHGYKLLWDLLIGSILELRCPFLDNFFFMVNFQEQEKTLLLQHFSLQC